LKSFKLKAQCVAITTKIEEQKVYILSISENDIIFPTLDIDKKNIGDLDKTVIENMKHFLMTNDLELAPQIIKIVPNEDNPNMIDIIYGFLIKEDIKYFNSYWINFNYQQPDSKHANLIFEVMQKLK
jgi:hypothetical protein